MRGGGGGGAAWDTTGEGRAADDGIVAIAGEVRLDWGSEGEGADADAAAEVDGGGLPGRSASSRSYSGNATKKHDGICDFC